MKVETQWHYEILTKFGYRPVTSEVFGLVRSYTYEKGLSRIVVTTGASNDYWQSNTGRYGLWNELENFLNE